MYSYQQVQVKMENSSYIGHQKAQHRGVLHKLVFHSNGDLCVRDWVPQLILLAIIFS